MAEISDKYSAVWVSHSSISDFLRCPRTYFLRSIYKNARGRKITVVNPYLSLGSAVHDVIESLAILPLEDRFKISLLKKLDTSWLKVTGKKGGFKNFSEESEYRDRAIAMLKKLEENPGPLAQKAIKIKTGKMDLPHYDLSVSDGIILCGKIDWLSYDEASDSVKIIDFKTGRHEENVESLQLPIYLLLASNTQSKKVNAVYYWYLDREDGLTAKTLPDIDKSKRDVLEIALKIKAARKKGEFVCPTGGCSTCRNLERVFKGEGELVATIDNRQDVYYLAD